MASGDGREGRVSREWPSVSLPVAVNDNISERETSPRLTFEVRLLNAGRPEFLRLSCVA